MKATLQGLMLTAGALTCFQSSHIAAMENIKLESLQKPLEYIGAASVGYFLGNAVTNHLENDNSYTKNLPLPKSEDNKQLSKEEITDLIKYTSSITAHNEKVKTWREGAVAAALALVSLNIDKYKYDLTDCEKKGLSEKELKDLTSTRSKMYGKDVTFWLINNFFDFYRSIETVYKKQGYGQTYMTNGSVNWSAIGKTSAYMLAAWAQISLPSFLHPRLKPFEKLVTRSLINKGLEMVFNNSAETLSKEALDQKKYNESLKDIITCSHGLYSAYKA